MKSYLANKAGIYCIENITNQHKYVGSASSLRTRKNRHFHDLNRQKHHSVYLQRAWNKYGSNNFIFYVLEFIDNNDDTLKKVEQKYLDSIRPEYNMSNEAARNKPSLDGLRRREKILSKEYIITKPDGTEIEIKNLRKFCLDNKLNEDAMSRVSSGKQGNYMRWKVKRKNNPFPEFKYKTIMRLKRKVKKDGTIYVFDDLIEFCKNRGISPASMQKILSGHRKEINGFTLIDNGK